MARRRARALVVVPALLVASGCATSSEGSAAPEETPAPVETSAPADLPPEELAPAELVPALGEPQTAEDALPTVEGRSVPENVVAGSVRHLGSTNAGEYWVALDEDGAFCVVQALKGAEAVTSSCAAAPLFADSGVWSGGRAPGASATGLVVPVGFDLADATREEDWVMVADNLAAPADEVG